jgi:aspartyl aminopeptidase
VHLATGQEKRMTLEIPISRFRHWDEAQGRYVVDSGDYALFAGSASDAIRAKTSVKISAAAHTDSRAVQ